MPEPREIHAPYPGLRAFEQHETPIFFGREAHVSRLLEILQRERFLAVVGSSGSGKSSLVRAGLLPALALGWTADTSDWRIAVLRPGERPLRRLAEALLAPQALGRELAAPGELPGEVPGEAPGEAPAEAVAAAASVPLIEAELRRGPLGLVALVDDAARLAGPQRPFNLLVLVDQFEEVFRYAEAGAAQGDESEAFVNLLLQPRLVAGTAASRIFVALTMRTDALQECARFLDLPEAINHAQYLTPRLKPDELRRAITEPVRVFGGTVDTDVVPALIEAVFHAPDQLPILQHALARMWVSATARDPGRPRVTATDVAQTGGITRALSLHADQVLASLPPLAQMHAQVLFRAITAAPESGQRDARRPQRLGDIARFGGRPEDGWPVYEPVLRAFGAEGVSFLHLSAPPGRDAVVDISHEALIRQWEQLAAWVALEAEQAAEYRRWRDRSSDSLERGGELLTGVDLAAAVRWRDGMAPAGDGLDPLRRVAADSPLGRPTPGWAARYARSRDRAQAAAEFARVLRFIDASAAQERQRLDAAEAADRERQAERERAAQAELAVARERAQAAAREKQQAQASVRRTRGLLALALVLLAVAVGAFVTAQRGAERLRQATGALQQAVRQATDSEQRAQAQSRLAAAAAASAATAQHQAEAAASEAGVAREQALAEARRARQALTDTTATRLAVEGQAVVAQARPGDAMTGVMRMLAAHRLQPGVESYSALQAAARQLHALERFIDTGATVTAVAELSDGRHIVAGGRDGAVRVWRRDGTLLHTLAQAHAGGVTSLAVSRDGRLLASGGADRAIRLWDSGTLQPLGAPLQGHAAAVTRLVFLPDGGRLVSAGADHALRLWDLAPAPVPESRVLWQHGSNIFAADVSPDGRWIAAAGMDGTVRLWDAADPGAAPRLLAPPRLTSLGLVAYGIVWHLAFSPDSQRLATMTDDGRLRLWDVASGQVRAETARAPSGLNRGLVAFTADGRRLVTGATDGNLRVWDAANLALPLDTLRGHVGRVRDLAASADGATLVSAGEGQTLRVWNLDHRLPDEVRRRRFDLRGAGLFAFDAAGRRMLQDHGGRLQLADTSDAAPPQDLAALPEDRSVRALALSPAGDRYAVALDDGSLWLGSTRPGVAPVRWSPAPPGVPAALAFGPDGRRLRLLWPSGELAERDAATGQWLARHRLPPVSPEGTALHSGPGARQLVVGDAQGTVRVFDLDAGRWRGDEMASPQGAVRSLALSADGRHLAVGHSGGTVQLWDLARRVALGESVRRHALQVSGLAFTPDGRSLLSNGSDGNLRHLPVLEAWVDALCAKLPRAITPDEWQRWVGAGLPYRAGCAPPDPARTAWPED